ncbi:hypothetical protein CC80DRAFT_547337 [Byssothecium circinans]|uniref:Uncharacterized protein n=1 Tax=Byssothecium circinans TaxID=147558 RepID=A0A6A5TXS4_9PLEO|nr:hypothetical protein CC80DRAFT_547337 [Byssothecium circinans]
MSMFNSLNRLNTYFDMARKSIGAGRKPSKRSRSNSQRSGQEQNGVMYESRFSMPSDLPSWPCDPQVRKEIRRSREWVVVNTIATKTLRPPFPNTPQLVTTLLRIQLRVEKIQLISVPTTVQELLKSRKPTRIAVFVRTKSPLHSHPPDEVVKAACSTLDIPIIGDSHPTLLVIEKWDRLDIFAFDVYHTAYNPSTAHHEASLPVVLVDYGKRYSVVKAAGAQFQKEVNIAVAREHDLNGWDATPPYIVDHTGTRVPTYPNPRSLITLRSKPAVQSEDLHFEDEVSRSAGGVFAT